MMYICIEIITTVHYTLLEKQPSLYLCKDFIFKRVILFLCWGLKLVIYSLFMPKAKLLHQTVYIVNIKHFEHSFIQGLIGFK